ncbi:hypothetical protein B4U80_09163 [Leptotrombidium deliense]|uniref:RNA-directed DNA polymerase n=1 Tax=Leptotrombidium deliense TaxID=299467 RepID=A0A443S171_9ACAR|nr:hypothetical protein B4U80_09163 [Leptotrombidium deliense]
MVKNPPVLAHFKRGRETEVHVDASLSGFGGVLIQRDEENKERVIEFASRRVSETEMNLHSNDLECSAAHWLITIRFRIYLYGLDFFTLITDNWTVAHLNVKRTINRKYARWIIELQEFNFKVKHRKGSQNVVADALSRQFDSEVVAMAIVVTKDKRLQLLQQQDNECVSIMKIIQDTPRTKSERKTCEQFQKCNGILCHKADVNGRLKTRIVIPQSLRETVLELVHDRSGHGDYKRTYAKLAERYYWKGFSVDLKSYVSSCEVCQRMNAKTSKATGLMTSRKAPETPFEAVSVDHFGPLECINGFKYVIVLVEHTTRYMICKPQKSTKSAEFIRFMEEEVVTRFGSPLVLISDRGTCFTSFETYEYFEKNGITHSTSPPYFPESNGLAERAVKTIKDTIRRQLDGCANWKSQLNRTVYAINTIFNSSIGYAPFELLFGFKRRIDNELLIGSVVENISRIDQIEEMRRNRIQASSNLKKSQEKQEKTYNEKRSDANFEIGDKVLFTT